MDHRSKVDPPVIDQDEECDQCDCHTLARAERPGDEIAQVDGECVGESGDGTGNDDQEDTPAVKECSEAAVGFVKEDVDSSRLGERSAQFGEGDRATKGQATDKN